MVELPSGKSIIKQGCTTAGDIIIGRTALMDKMGVGSELEYKKQSMKDNRIKSFQKPKPTMWKPF